MATLSIVIVTLNRREEVMSLLLDLAAMRLAPGDEILVVDNGSTDGTAEAVRGRHPEVRLIRHETNRGAPAGRNAGAAAARGEILVFLDDDVRVADGDMLSHVRRIFGAEPEAGVVAFRILNPATGQSRSFEIPSRRKERATEPFETSYFIAAGCAIRKSVYEAVGGMDESLTYGFEELDFGYRAVARGHRIFYRPEVWIYHGLSSTGRPGWRAVYYFHRNKIWISLRYLPWRMVLTQVLVWSVYFLREALRIGRPDVFVRALAAGLAGAPRRIALRRRDRLSRKALERLRGLGGRLYT